MTLAESYENWFGEGNRPLAEFLDEVECDESQVCELVLLDQHLRYKAGLSYEPTQYQSLSAVGDQDFQVELWLEAFGYAEQDGVTADAFLEQVPTDLLAAVREQVGDITLPGKPPPSGSHPPQLERYRIDDELGRGAFGVVYRAWDTQLDRGVALKVLHSESPSDDDFAEARLIAGLEHPGLVAVYDCGADTEGRGFLVTQLIEGQSLGEWAGELDSKNPDDQQRVCRLFAKLCDALSAAHQRGVVHRDLKPGNVLVRGMDEPVILDFGLALSDWTPGREGEWVGTPAYMSPEQARGEGHLVDPRSDVFAVGILLFEVLTGRRPWKSGSTRELLREIAHGSVRSVRQFTTEIPTELECICRKATAASMSDRYASAREMANDLRWSTQNKTESGPHSAVSKIAARGLRPYTAEDSGAYWTLLPGYRNARGVPECVAWWLARLQDDDAEHRRGVMVLYGPSGSGKSSLLHAGVLPFLDSRRSLVCSLDASEFESADVLKAELARTTKQESASGLSELVARLRDRSSRRIVIAMDQFEQILAWDASEREEVVLALRQADGARLQVVLVVRDEFWSATSRLMRDLDSALRDDRNAMGLERFSTAHARHVLETWADAAPKESVVDDEFIDAAVALVAENDHVVPVRLALLACVLGDEPWTIARLEAIAKRGSLSARYLDSVLGTASAKARRFSEPARRLLSELTPPTGLIRGPARSAGDLRLASNLSETEFEDLLDLLDRRSHLITPVDRAESANEDVGAVHYNLPHDFLVPELRNWLEEIERTSPRGRAAADLRSRAQHWSVEQDANRLAGPFDCVRFGLLARPTNGIERRYLQASAKRSLMRSMTVAILAIAAAALFQFALLRAGGRALVQRLCDCGVDQLPEVIAETRVRWSFAERPLREVLRRSIESGETAKRDRLALALLANEPDQSKYLGERALHCEPDLLRQILTRMQQDLAPDDRKAMSDWFASIADDEMYVNEHRLRAAIAIATLQDAHGFWEHSAGRVCEMLVDTNPTEIGWLSEGFLPVRSRLTPELVKLVADSEPEQLRTATFLLAKFASDDEAALVQILEDAVLTQLPAVAPTIRAAKKSIDDLLQSRLEQLLDDYLDVAMDMEIQSLRSSLAAPDGRGNPLLQRRVFVARQAANLAVLLFQRDRGDEYLHLLKSSSDPTLRSYLIQCYAVSEGPAEPIAKYLLSMTTDAERRLEPDVAAALLQILGSLPASSQVPIAIRDLAQQWSRSSPDGELNASADWFLRHQGYHSELDAVSDNAGWTFRTSEGHLMVRLPAAQNVTVGASSLDTNQLANENPHEINVPSGVYFSRNEVTVRQFNRFLKARRRPLIETRGGVETATAMRIGFYQAAAYCNWLSDQEGIPEDEWCFVPNQNGHYAAGMSIVEDPLSRSGYQLPTADLWEYACRAGTRTPRYYGHGIELSTPYVRWLGSRTSASRNQISLRKPNAFGLCDMLGNASEWSLSLVSDSSANRISIGPGPRDPGVYLQRSRVPGLAFGGGPEHENGWGQTITDRTRLLTLGGSFDSPAHKVRASDRSLVSPPVTNQPIGIRLMRIAED